MTTAVVDANLFLRMLLPSQLDARALTLWRRFVEQGTEIVVPSQAVSETMSTLRSHVFHKRISIRDGERLFRELQFLVGVCRTEPAQWGAWAVARRFGRPTTYDSEFYALAEQLGAELWTADDRFVNAMGRRRPPWVRRLSDVEAEPS